MSKPSAAILESLSDSVSIDDFLYITEEFFRDNIGPLEVWLVEHSDLGYRIVPRKVDFLVPGLSGVIKEEMHPAIVAIDNKLPVWIARLDSMHKSMHAYIDIWKEELEAEQIFAIPLSQNALKSVLGVSSRENFLDGTNRDLLIKCVNQFDEMFEDLVSAERRAEFIENTLSTLTPRQLQILKLIGANFPNKDIAVQLDVSESTVRLEATEIYRLLGLSNRVETEAFCLENNIR